MIAFAVWLLAAVPPGAGGAGCRPATPSPGIGVADPFAAPAPRATELNAAGKTLYRQGKWDDARGQYRAALAADPAFLAPRLNVACSFVRQERFGEAFAEARALLDAAYVPWAREILEAADLGALKVRPEMADLRRAMAEAAARWGAGLEDAIIFVARQRAPLHVPETGAGVFILNPHQEAYAFVPTTGLYRQLTAEDGHVLALARSPDGRRLVYVTAEKLVRGTAPDALALRGVAITELTLATMALAPSVRIDGDVQRLEIGSAGGGLLAFRVDQEGAKGRFTRIVDGALAPFQLAERSVRPLAVLTPHGTLPAPPFSVRKPCAVSARETAGPAVRHLELSGPAHHTRKIGERFGAGLAGLPIP